MQNLKGQFLLDPSVTFLNHGSFGATPKPVFKEYQRWQRELENQPVEFLGRRITGLMADSRAALGSYLGTHADNLIYTQNVTISLNIVAHSLELGANDEVLATDHEYGAMDRTWRFLSKEHGFNYINRHVEIPLTTAEKFVNDFWGGVTKNTRVIFISHITSPTAVIFPVEEIIRRAREAGIITIIDGAHAAGQITLDLNALGADFYAGNLHKWLCAPKGAGFLYARPELQRLLKPLIVSWGYESEFPSGSNFVDQHEWWGTRDMAAFLSVPSAIEFQAKNNWDDVRNSCHRLLSKAIKRICEFTGMAPLHPRSDPWFRQMAAVPLPADTDVLLLKNRLYDEYRIEVPVYEWFPHPIFGERGKEMVGEKLIRISVQGYNTKRDIEKLCRSLFSLLKLE
jgi:isopenicillin-N epimerase